VEERAVSYAPSLAILRAEGSPKAQTAKSTLLAFANPARAEVPAVPSAYRSVALGGLPEAETEVRGLLPLYDRRGSRAYFRDQARESEFKKEAGSYDVIHIAAHAIVDDLTPMYSAIVLADDGAQGAEDGLLEAREIVDLELKARLAILSACDTARGGVKMGEGVIGLSWALMTAGCPTTVVSQWRAESKATALLMVEFHRRLAASDSPARAMREAQRKLQRNPLYNHPLYWAPFVVIGAP
jgi:CHAT domain-containing protein